MSKVAEKIKNLPLAPGVYFFCDSKGKILYIGKATNLKTRVQSYFRSDIASSRSQWIAQMIAQVASIDFEQTDSVLEALILESNLIKKHQPKYNTLEKDDKSFSYFVITKEDFPKFLILRKTDIDLEKLEAKSYKLKAIYGPYISKQQMQTALKIIRRIFPFHSGKQKTEKGCLDFQISLCPGPYAGAISKIDYKKNIRGIEMILQGKKKSLVSKLEKEMLLHSKKNEFEKAAILRNKIFALNHIRDVALMSRDFEEKSLVIGHQSFGLRIEAYDISNISGEHAVGSMIVFENGQANKNQYRKFKIKTVEGSNDVAMMKEVLSRRFNNDWAMPDLILLDGGLGHLNMAEELLHQELGLVVAIVGVAKGPTRKKLDLRRDSRLRADMNKRMENILENENLMKSIMDEAHRFAIGYHRKLRSKSFLG
ncbi:MAG: GIY-YIG nuclease family protein [Candidatus Moranbacteria bacterium]|nr:GIY-YIG nuclease family protein [Candidatus Moranbacteria bacterium]